MRRATSPLANHRKKLSALICSLIVVTAGILVLQYSSNKATALSSFNPGNIISDSKMADYEAMSEAEIRSFINSKNKDCSSSNSLCFRNYKENGKDTARIIFEASREQKINPQVILVTIQKEQGLVTRTNPAQWMYNSAMGYNCPDSTPGRCGSDEKGFLRQVIWGSTMYRAILDGGGKWGNRYASGTLWYTPYLVGNNSIQWNPNASCGSSTVNIQNRATQALYNYTPYRPNQAALNAGYGEGNNCSAYGNRNFYLFMRDWFDYRPGQQVYFHSFGFTEEHPNANRETSLEFTLTNASRNTINLGRIKVECISPTGKQHDLPSVRDIKVEPWKKFTYEQPTTFTEEGDWSCYLSRNFNGEWVRPVFKDLGFSYDPLMSFRLTNTPRLTEGLSISPAVDSDFNSIHAEQDITARFKMKNTSTEFPVNVGRHKVQTNFSDGTQLDFPSTPDNNIIQPGEEFEYEKTIRLPRTGSYSAFINNHLSGKWNQTLPLNESNDITRTKSFEVMPQATITKSLELSEPTTHAGKDLVATFEMTNHGSVPINVGRHKVEFRRSSNNLQYDLPSTVNHNIIQPGQTYKYEESGRLPQAGEYSAFINNRLNNHWSQSYPSKYSTDINTKTKIKANPQVTLTESLGISENPTRENRNITATFKMTNHGHTPVNVGRHKVQLHHSDGTQYDFASTPNNNIIQPGETYEYEASRSLPKNGTYEAFINNNRDGAWYSNYPSAHNSDIQHNLNLKVWSQTILSESLQFSKVFLHKNELLTATFKMTNHGHTPVNVGRHKVQLHHSDGTQYDFASTPNNNIIQPGETYEYEASRSLPKNGTYEAFINNNRDGAWYSNYPINGSSKITRSETLTVR